MLWISSIGVWFALCVSFAVSAGIIGMPTGSIVYEIVRVTVLFATLAGIVVGGRMVLGERRRDDGDDMSLEPLRDA
jgi:hypothetical protein